MNMTLIFGGDSAGITENYGGALIYQCSMVVPLKEVTSELKEKNKFLMTRTKNKYLRMNL
ncbi:MAG: hypothetical protein K0R54_550 [Clostridiaceae bacterium]|jgi:hypothetical protein|nr:hypothetical protein [Clostridiaceae bacterium]